MLSLEMSKDTKTFSKEELVKDMKKISGKWHKGVLPGEDGNAGRTLEELLGIKENNFKIPDYGEFQIKSQKMTTKSLVTIFHKEPDPPASVPKVLDSMGWFVERKNKFRFSSTTYSNKHTARGFTIDWDDNKIYFKFDSSKVKKTRKDQSKSYKTLGDWLNDIETRTPHHSSILPLHYSKQEIIDHFVLNYNKILFAVCESKIINDIENFNYREAYILQDFSLDNFKRNFDENKIIFDFNVSTGHNHGVGVRIKKNNLYTLYSTKEKIL